MSTDSSSSTPNASSGRFSRKWLVAVILLAFFSVILWRVVNPYRNQPYEEVPHGDHSHYVPKDRKENVSISRFPTREPEENERITPEGKIVPKSK